MPILLEAFARQIWKGDPEFALPGSGLAAPLSIRATLSFNGITINDLTTIDRYVVTSVDGFYSADIRSNSIPNPGDHGETPLNNFVGGRTMLITGYIEAHNAERLEDLTQALVSSFYSMTEKPLVLSIADIDRDVQIMARLADKPQFSDRFDGFQFRRNFQLTLRATDPRWYSLLKRHYTANFGLYDQFLAPSPLANWTLIDGDEPDVQTGEIAASTSDNSLILLDSLGYQPIDARITTKVTTGNAVNDNTFIEIRPKFIDVNNSLSIRLTTNGSSSTIAIYSISGGSATKLAESSTFTPSANTSYWLSYVQQGNLVGATLYSDDDPYDSSGTIVATVGTTLANNDALQFGEGTVGHIALFLQQSTQIVVNDFRVEALSLDHDVITAVNVGNWTAPPTIRIHGYMKNVVITNRTPLRDETQPRFIKINGEIPAGTYYEYSAADGSLVSADGTDHFAQIDVASRPLLIEGLNDGPNIIAIKAEEVSTIDARIEVMFNNTWL